MIVSSWMSSRSFRNAGKVINVKSECVFAGISFLSAAKLREILGGENYFL